MSLTARERLAARKAEIAEVAESEDEARAERELVDLEKIEELRTELGRSNVTIVELPFSPGLPVLVAARCPRPAEIKKYQDRLREEKPDPAAAAREVSAACRVYPDAETWAKVLEARPGLGVQLGVEALKLAAGKVRDAGKG